MSLKSRLGAVVVTAVVGALTFAAGCGSPSRSSEFDGGAGGGGSSGGGSNGGSGGGFTSSGSSGGGFGTGGTASGASSGGDSGVTCPAGLQCNVVCGSSTTSISGTVYDPAMLNPLYNVTVYVPQTPLQPLPSGVLTGTDACSCAALFKSGMVVGTTTDTKGQFTLKNVPVGSNVPLVLQVGKWRHVVTIPTVTQCMDNPQPDKSLALNGTVAAGSDDNMPDIAVSTGHSDTLECLMKRVGVADTEFVPGTATTGHVHLYDGGDPKSPYHGTNTNGHPTPELVPMPGAPESDTNLWDSQAHMMPYDITLLSCEGGETYNANPPVLEQYLNAGGRVFLSHYHYKWFVQTTPVATPADWSSLATWTPGAMGSGPGMPPAWGNVVQTLNVGTGPFPKGVALAAWLQTVGALGVGGVPSTDVPLYQQKFNAVVGPADTASQNWITTPGPLSESWSEFFSFDTPVTAMPGPDGGAPNYCGRAVFSGMHVTGDPTAAASMDSPNGATTSATLPGDMPPPAGCASGALSPQEKVLEFMLFDLSSCVVSDKVPPTTTVY